MSGRGQCSGEGPALLVTPKASNKANRCTQGSFNPFTVTRPQPQVTPAGQFTFVRFGIQEMGMPFADSPYEYDNATFGAVNSITAC